MFRPLENEALDNWFRRLNAPLKRLPAEEQARLNEEVGQHLEALVAANEAQGRKPEEAWMLALDQFGDPERFGQQMAEEWRQSRIGFRADMIAILFGLGLYVLLWPVQHPLCDLWFQSLRDAHGISILGFVSVLRAVIGYGSLIGINAAIGLKYPVQALKSAFYGHIVWHAGTWISAAVFWTVTTKNGIGPVAWVTMVTHPKFLLLVPLWALLGAAIAYLASVTKRGWYRPTVDDLKISLPRRRSQLSR